MSEELYIEVLRCLELTPGQWREWLALRSKVRVKRSLWFWREVWFLIQGELGVV